MTSAIRIALVEDDAVIRENYADMLRSEGFVVETFATDASARERLALSLPDLALLDIALGANPEAGYGLCAWLRERSQTLPIIFLTSHSSNVDRISGLRLGADDYITKDTPVDYLVIRIRTLFRRIEALRSNQRTPDRASNNLTINDVTLVATWRQQPLRLSLTQFWMLRALVDHPGQVLSHKALMQAANVTIEPNTVVAHIKAIRSKFREVDPEFDCIRTERGSGYRWLPHA
ncbi:MAG: response regulator [Pseudomonadales bacterium]